jgi:hypothetical protein
MDPVLLAIELPAGIMMADSLQQKLAGRVKKILSNRASHSAFFSVLSE